MSTKQKTIFFSVGEPSGDLHGANLIRRLQDQADVHCVGFGGPRMEAAGCELLADLTKLALMWFVQVLLHLPSFLRLLRAANRYFRDQRPDAVVLIDYPGFNWWVARRAKAHGIPVFYYGTPQMWAWASWRVHKMRRLVDHVLCKLPFEETWFRARDCPAQYIGHPYFDELVGRVIDLELVAQLQSAAPIVAVLPGSRTQEVHANLPVFLETARKVHQQVPSARFVIASFNEKQAEIAREMLGEFSDLPIQIQVGGTPEVIHAARCCLACSGSVSLELLYHEKPTVIHYGIQWLPYQLQRRLRRSKYITLVNLLATDEITRAPHDPDYDPDDPTAEQVPFPEYVTCTDRSQAMTHWLVTWLESDVAVEQIRQRLSKLKASYAQPGASQRAASYILRSLVETNTLSRMPDGPHLPKTNSRTNRHVSG